MYLTVCNITQLHITPFFPSLFISTPIFNTLNILSASFFQRHPFLLSSIFPVSHLFSLLKCGMMTIKHRTIRCDALEY